MEVLYFHIVSVTLEKKDTSLPPFQLKVLNCKPAKRMERWRFESFTFICHGFENGSLLHNLYFSHKSSLSHGIQSFNGT